MSTANGGGHGGRPRRSALVTDSDRFAAAALAVDRLKRWIDRRNAQRSAALPEEAAWDHTTSSGAGIYSEAETLFPGPRSAWVR